MAKKMDAMKRNGGNQYKMVIDPQDVRQYGFANTAQLVDYKDNQYFSPQTTNTRKNQIQIEDAPFGGKNTAIVRGRQDAARFVKYLKENLNIGVESYGNNSWFVHYKSNSDYSKKLKTPKSKKKK